MLRRFRTALALACLLAPGCAYAMPHAYRVAAPTSDVARATGPSLTVAEERQSRRSSAPSFWFEESADSDDRGSGGGSGATVASGLIDVQMESMVPDTSSAPAQPQRQLAQAQTAVTPPEPTATDAVDTSGELLVYTALFHVAVYDVAAAEAAISEDARAAGGFVFAQSDDSLVLRVPAARFTSFVSSIDGEYDVLHRQIEAQDVGEEFRDVEIRIRNLEAMRDRVAALLESAHDVEQALAVEQQLERITGELESLRGRQRFLADRISLSTITILFRPQPHDAIDQPEVFQLPFAWLESLGLPNLLELR